MKRLIDVPNEMIVAASIQLEESAYNRFLGRAAFEETLSLHRINIVVVNVDPLFAKFWTNDQCTIVFYVDDSEIDHKSKQHYLMQSMMRIAADSRPDEVETMRMDDKVLVRFWWD